MLALKEVTSFLLSSNPVLVVSDRARPQVAGTYRSDDNVGISVNMGLEIW